METGEGGKQFMQKASKAALVYILIMDENF